MDFNNDPCLEPVARDFYRKAMHILMENRLPFLVGGAHALNRFTGITRDTKDFDIFLLQHDSKRALELLNRGGYRTQLTDELWIAKAFCGPYYVDLIFNSANCISKVDDQWFEHSVPNEVLGVPVLLIPPEEMILSKAFVMDRDRFDGADIVHLILRCSDKLDWQRLLERFGDYWEVLYLYVLYFNFVYPSQAELIPPWLVRELSARSRELLASKPPTGKLCRGPLFSTSQYQIDLNNWGFVSAKTCPPWLPPATGQDVA